MRMRLKMRMDAVVDTVVDANGNADADGITNTNANNRCKKLATISAIITNPTLPFSIVHHQCHQIEKK